LGAEVNVTEVRLKGWIVEEAEVELEVSWVRAIKQDEVLGRVVSRVGAKPGFEAVVLVFEAVVLVFEAVVLVFEAVVLVFGACPCCAQ
jgi:hypothetical protein